MPTPKQIVQPGESLHIPMLMMDAAANTVDALHKRLTDAQVALRTLGGGEIPLQCQYKAPIS